MNVGLIAYVGFGLLFAGPLGLLIGARVSGAGKPSPLMSVAVWWLAVVVGAVIGGIAHHVPLIGGLWLGRIAMFAGAAGVVRAVVGTSWGRAAGTIAVAGVLYVVYFIPLIAVFHLAFRNGIGF